VSIRKKALALAVIVAAAIGSAFVIASPAEAVNSHVVGHPGYEQRCLNDQYNVCLYYNTNYTQDAYWGIYFQEPDLGTQYFLPFTGAGSNQIVKNNSNFMFCTIYNPGLCVSYRGTGWTGDYDYESYNNIGQLWYTINRNASIWPN